jgi:hypothetical protein
VRERQERTTKKKMCSIAKYTCIPYIPSSAHYSLSLHMMPACFVVCCSDFRLTAASFAMAWRGVAASRGWGWIFADAGWSSSTYRTTILGDIYCNYKHNMRTKPHLQITMPQRMIMWEEQANQIKNYFWLTCQLKYKLLYYNYKKNYTTFLCLISPHLALPLQFKMGTWQVPYTWVGFNVTFIYYTSQSSSTTSKAV